MKMATFALLLMFALPVSAKLIAYDYEAQFYDIDGTPKTSSGVTGTIVFDLSLLGLKQITARFDDESLLWRSNAAAQLQMRYGGEAYGSRHDYLEIVGNGFDEGPENYGLWYIQEIYITEPTSLYAVLSKFNRYWTPETTPVLDGPGFYYGNFGFSDIGPAYSVPEPATLSLLALGLAAIGIRRRVTARLR